MGQGKENSKIFLSENEDIAKEIENKIKEQIGANDEIMEFIDDNVENEATKDD